MGSKVISGIKWVAIERFSNQFIQFVISIIISRIISPTDYGILGILLVFINIFQVFVDSGLGSSLIYFNKIKKDDLNTTFIFNLSISLFSVLLIFFTAPYIESFYQIQDLSEYLRLSTLILLVNSIVVVPTAILKIKLDFKSLSSANLISNALSAIIAVYMAYTGYGVWALIWQILSKSIILASILWMLCHWTPSFEFKKNSFLKLYKYGVNLFTTSLITKFTDEGIATIIAKFLSPFNLGLFTRSGQFANFPTSCIGSIISTIMFPALSSCKKDSIKYNKLYLSSLKLQSFIIIPLYIFLAAEAKPIIIILLTEKWIDAIPIFQILCLGRILSLLGVTIEQNLNARGYSNLCLRQQIFKLIVKITFVAIALPFGIVAVALGDALQTIFQFFITAFVAKRAIGYTVNDQFKICIPFLVSGVISGLSTYLCIYLFNNIFIQLIFPLLIGIIIYLALVIIIFKQKEPLELLRKFI